MAQKSYHHGNLREELLDAAVEQINAEGAAALNLSKLARTVGVSQPAAYRHFANKQALAVSLGIRGYEQLRERIETRLATLDEGATWLRHLETSAEAYVNFVRANPELARLMFSLKERMSHEQLYAASKSIAAALYAIVGEAKQTGRLQNDDVDATVRVIWSTIHGMAVLLMDEQLPRVIAAEDGVQVFIREAMRVLYAGLFSE